MYRGRGVHLELRSFFAVRKRSSSHVHVHFTGGVACFNEACCRKDTNDTGDYFDVKTAAAIGCMTESALQDQLAKFGVPFSGLLADDPENPLQNYTYVFAPQCSRDFWMGNAIKVDYGQDCSVSHYGSPNGIAVMDWVFYNLKETLQSVVVSGSSAGGYGSLYHGARLANMVQTLSRNVEVSWLGDSAPGVAVAPSSWGINNGGILSEILSPSPTGFLKVILPEEGSSIYWFLETHRLMIQKIGENFPCMRMGEFNFDNDTIQAAFFGSSGDALFNQVCPAQNCSSLWPIEALSALTNTTLPNYSFFWAHGTNHTIVLNETFFSLSGKVFANGKQQVSVGLPQWFSSYLLNFTGNCTAEAIPTPRPTTTSRPPPPTLTPKPEPACFPANARVELINGSRVRMIDLQIGDRVRTGKDSFSDIFFFGHRMTTGTFWFKELRTTKGVVVVSSNHLVWASKGLIPAGYISRGELVQWGDGTMTKVESVSWVRSSGIFNPHTFDGSIVVDGVLASCFTTAVYPVLGQVLLAPFRVLYQLGLTVPSILDDSLPTVVSSHPTLH